MRVIVFAALVGAPLADFRTQRTNLIRKLAFPRHCLHTRFADFDALCATTWTIVVALFATHFIEALGAGDDTFLTSFDTTAESTHDLFLPKLVANCERRTQSDARTLAITRNPGANDQEQIPWSK